MRDLPGGLRGGCGSVWPAVQAQLPSALYCDLATEGQPLLSGV